MLLTSSLSIWQGTTNIQRLGDAVHQLSQQATQVTARADAISERKFSFLEAKLKAEAEAAVEAVERREKKLRVKDAEEFAEMHG